MNIRPLKKTDINKCARLFMQAYNCAPWNHQWVYEKAVVYLSEYASRSRFVGFVLCEDDDIVGAMLGHSKTWWTNDLLYVDELFISPERQRLGYGKQLLDHTENYCKENDYDVVTLMTNKYMPAIKFYKGIDYIHAEQYAFMFKSV